MRNTEINPRIGVMDLIWDLHRGTRSPECRSGERMWSVILPLPHCVIRRLQTGNCNSRELSHTLR